jgi:hypothetical protein
MKLQEKPSALKREHSAPNGGHFLQSGSGSKRLVFNTEFCALGVFFSACCYPACSSGKLMADTPAARTLRGIIVEKAPARFLAGLGKFSVVFKNKNLLWGSYATG